MIDLAFLTEFTKGDKNKMVKYIKLYLELAPGILDMMKNDLSRKDWQNMAINAHSLKPQADFMGNKEMKLILEEIEEKVRTASPANLPDLYTDAKQSHEKAAVILREVLDDLSR